MSTVEIPLDVFTDPAYRSLTRGHQALLIEFYALFGDCQTFVIDCARPTEYGEMHEAQLYRRINILLASGLIVLAGLRKMGHRSRNSRVFAFKYAAQDMI